jgi:hypothetical protein
MNKSNLFAAIFGVSCAALVSTLSACMAAPQVVERPAQTAAQATTLGLGYAQLMDSAQEALQRNEAWAAIGFLERAAKNEPAKKQPWQRIAQMQFDAKNYGQAITAANEILVRDNTDTQAKRILALSGMRISAQAFEQLGSLAALDTSSQTEATLLLERMQQQAKPSGHSGVIGFTAEERRAMEQPIQRVAVPVAVPVPTKPRPQLAVQPQTPQPGVAYDPLRALRN